MEGMHLWSASCILACLLGSVVLAYDNQRCLTSCLGRADGKYQSCKNCRVYVTCTRGLLMDGWPCPRGTVWDDDAKICQTKSVTCTEQIPQQTNDDCQCASSCRGLSNGKYQSCTSCSVYALCRNGRLLDNQPCPRYSFWDDNYKRCLFRSSTCGPDCQDDSRPYQTAPPVYVTPPPASSSTTQSPGQEEQFRTPGKWPSFTTQPDSQQEEQNRTPPKWPSFATKKPSSGTVCGCITDCKGKEDGSHPSCRGCEYFALCFQGQIYDAQECPAGRVWYAKGKTCVERPGACKTDCTVPATEAPEEEESEESEEVTEEDSDQSNGSDGDQDGGQRPNAGPPSRESESRESESRESESRESESRESESRESDSDEKGSQSYPGGQQRWHGRWHGHGRGRGGGRGRGWGRGRGGY